MAAATLDAFMDYIDPFIKNCKELWKKSKYFRIISIVTGSITASLLARNAYVYTQRKYLKLPPGPFGFPFIGGSFIMLNQFKVEKMVKYGPAASMTVGNKNCILINNPYLAKQYYSRPESLDMISEFINPLSFAFENGKVWSERRRLISANLMSTMKASYVEDVTKTFIKTKLFPIFNNDIENNNVTNMKTLFRPIGFNIVLQACIGTNINSLNDPFWKAMDNEAQIAAQAANTQLVVSFLFGNSKLSERLQELFTGSNVFTIFDKQIALLDAFAKKNESTIENKDNNVKLFNDYINDYTKNSETKWNKKQFLADMVVMIQAAQETTYATLSFALLIAAKYPNLQNELYEEIVKAFGNDVDNIELKNEGIFKMPKLRAFIQETLRLYPPVPVSGFRQMNSNKGIILNSMKYGADKDYIVSHGIMTIVNASGIGKNPEYWIRDYKGNENKYKHVNMNEVNLSFWMDDEGHFSKKKNLQSFWAFHKGKRDCVGQALAMKNLIIVLSMIFMKYKVESKDGTTDFDITPFFSGVVSEPKTHEIRLKKR